MQRGRGWVRRISPLGTNELNLGESPSLARSPVHPSLLPPPARPRARGMRFVSEANENHSSSLFARIFAFFRSSALAPEGSSSCCERLQQLRAHPQNPLTHSLGLPAECSRKRSLSTSGPGRVSCRNPVREWRARGCPRPSVRPSSSREERPLFLVPASMCVWRRRRACLGIPPRALIE